MTLETLLGTANTVVFTWEQCPYCIKAKALLTPMTENIKVYDLKKIEGGDAIHAEIIKSTGHETVPAVYIGGKLIGGFSDVDALNRAGKLEGMVKV